MKPPVLALKDVRLADGPKMLFDGVDLAVEPRSRACLVGRNGAGKSTLLKILAGQIAADEGERTVQPSIRIAYVPQEPDIAGETLLDYVVAGGAEPHRGEAALELFGIDPAKPAKGLSGGEIRRAALARAFAEEPDVILLDEPTNHLDLEAIAWLEEFLINLDSTVIVVSHDRHFLNKVCTHTVDIDYKKVTMYVGNYDFWYEYTQMAQRQMREQNKKAEAKIKELQDFISRFSANASKSKQATSRKKLLDSIKVEDIPVSSRRFPYVDFKPDRKVGN